MNRSQSLSEQERFPLLTAEGGRLLEWLREHPSAPRYNYRCGDQLTPESLERVRAYEAELFTAKRGWSWNEAPLWAKRFAEECLKDVPFYRGRGGSAEDFPAIPTCWRGDLSREPWSFVPDSQPVDELIVYNSTGTTGHPLYILSHAEVSSKYLPALRAALSRCKVALEGGSGRVSIITVCAQTSTLTYASVSSYLGDAGYVKINLNPSEWRDPEDRARFLDSCDAEVYTGDPISFVELAKLPLKTRPKALISSAMTMLPGLRRELEGRFNCPVVDVYSMNESRFIAASTGAEYEIIPHDLYVEILDRSGAPCPPGVRGEITLTGGRNPFLPLLRYRTGDYAAMEFRDRPVLVEFEGRRPVVFLNTEGKIVNNIDVTQALKPFAIAQFSLHQSEDRALTFRMRPASAAVREIRSALLALFGQEQALVVAEMADEDLRGGKVLQYTSDIDEMSIGRAQMSYSV